VNTSHAIEIDGATLAALRDYASQARLDALCAGTGPLADDDRQALQDALQWWQEQHASAETRVREIVARLARQ
jgi:hypothetical protein